MRLCFVLFVLVVTACSNEAGDKVTSDGGPVDAERVDMSAADGGQAEMGDRADMRSQDASNPAPDMRREEDMGTTMLPAGVCGNLIVETGETCDDCSDLDCNDSNRCTVDFAAGDASSCSAYCRNDEVSHCQSDDGCCPTGCTPTTDNDCSTSCGDFVIDALETCDGDCPTSCDDENSATRDLMVGTAANCNVQCVHVPILRCVDGDGFCPAGCLELTDDDCASECGNGVVETGETCDPPGSCPSCDDGNPCTADETSGSAATCDVTCSSTPIDVCANGDGCCGPRCDADEDDDCSATCGDGVVQPPETCEGPQSCNALVCMPLSCETAVRTGHHQSCNIDCGYVETTGCQGGDGCCPLGCTAASDNDCEAICGNGVLEPGEFCDPPGLCEIACPDDRDACTTVAVEGSPETCDGRCVVTNITECLDDGCCPANCNANNDPDCVPFCGNGVVEAGEVCDGNCPNCDDANACTIDTRVGLPERCNVMCEHAVIVFCGADDGCCPSGVGCNSLTDPDCAPICGNGLIEDGETCDGNCPASCDDLDACTTDQQVGGAATCDLVCSNVDITACTGGDGCCPAGCNANTDTDCASVCGNNVTEPGETCDGNCGSCNDQNACTADSQTGDAASCDLVCTNDPITTCTGGDGCCPATCTNLNDSDCP